MELVGYIGAIVIGVCLGLIGGGGSVLTIPVLVYLLEIDVVTSTSYSLAIVAMSSLFGAIVANIKKQCDCKVAMIFAIPSIVSVYLTRLYLVPNIPDPLMNIGEFDLSKDIGILLLFAVIMIGAGLSMLGVFASKKEAPKENETTIPYSLIMAEGVLVGILTGVVGAGGGFLIVPVLVMMVGLPMKKAIGTSLTIIAAKSMLGFVGDLQTDIVIDWAFLVPFIITSVAGIAIGTFLSSKVSSQALKKGFGVFVLVMSTFIILKELFIK